MLLAIIHSLKIGSGFGQMNIKLTDYKAVLFFCPPPLYFINCLLLVGGIFTNVSALFWLLKISNTSYSGLKVSQANSFIVLEYMLSELEELNLFRDTSRIFSPTLNLNPSEQQPIYPFSSWSTHNSREDK